VWIIKLYAFKTRKSYIILPVIRTNPFALQDHPPKRTNPCFVGSALQHFANFAITLRIRTNPCPSRDSLAALALTFQQLVSEKNVTDVRQKSRARKSRSSKAERDLMMIAD
jgi:hypothetical protein